MILYRRLRRGAYMNTIYETPKTPLNPLIEREWPHLERRQGLFVGTNLFDDKRCSCPKVNVLASVAILLTFFFSCTLDVQRQVLGHLL